VCVKVSRCGTHGTWCGRVVTSVSGASAFIVGVHAGPSRAECTLVSTHHAQYKASEVAELYQVVWLQAAMDASRCCTRCLQIRPRKSSVNQRLQKRCTPQNKQRAKDTEISQTHSPPCPCHRSNQGASPGPAISQSATSAVSTAHARCKLQHYYNKASGRSSNMALQCSPRPQQASHRGPPATDHLLITKRPI
jgi:hypothetical protein